MNAETDSVDAIQATNIDTSVDESLILPIDAFVRSIGVHRATPIAMFLGAGASVSSGIPSAQMCIWEWKRQIFLTKNPGLEEQFAEISLDGVRRRIQRWLDRQGDYPNEDSPEEYGFYIRECFPIPDDRRAYFADLVRKAAPHIGYHLLGHLAQSDLIRSVWSPNFDHMTGRTAANFKLTPIEASIDTQARANRSPSKGELLCVSVHGDYRYDLLKNTSEELREQEAILCRALITELQDRTLVVSGYSGRDASLMAALKAAYTQPGNGILYWSGFGDIDPPDCVSDLIRHARANGRKAYYIPSFGFDDLLTRLSLHCLQGEARKAAIAAIEEFSAPTDLDREPWQVPKFSAATLIKSNSFPIECPSEMLRFDLHRWPEKNTVWTSIRAQCDGHPVVAAPFKGRIYALGLIDQIKEVFGNNIKGPIERTPVAPKEISHGDSAVLSLMVEALTRSMAEIANVQTDARRELWKTDPREDQRNCPRGYAAHDSLRLYLRRVNNVQYLVLMPSIKILDKSGATASFEVVNPAKLAILGYQHNKPFNRAVMDWRAILLPKDRECVFEFPNNCGSTFRFKVKRSPVFGEIGLPQGGKIVKVPSKLQPLIRYSGVQLAEPNLVFSNKTGTGPIQSPHPIRGIADNRPFDYALTARGFLSELRVGVICASSEARSLSQYLQNSTQTLSPRPTEQDYLVNYPGFQSAFGIPIQFAQPGENGWFACPEPSSNNPHTNALQIASHINRGVELLQSTFAPHVVLIFYPSRWQNFRGYRTDSERFDVHDFVKAFCVQRGIATQFLNEDTFADQSQCRVWWWLSLALYVKAMRTPWVLNSLANDTAFVGLGFSVDPAAERGRHVVLGCSHIYSGKGEGLQYRLSKVENPIFYGKNPFMSKDDARRTGETIRQLFFDARFKLPDRVVIHKRTHFTQDEREGLADGLSGIKHIDMLEIQIDNAMRYVASVPTGEGGFDDDNYPVRRGTAMKLDDFTALVWVHGATTALHPKFKYFQGKRRIPAPLTVRRHAGRTDLKQVAEEILGLSKMNWNTFDLYTKLPATVHSSNEIARIGSLLQRIGSASYDYRLFI